MASRKSVESVESIATRYRRVERAVSVGFAAVVALGFVIASLSFASDLLTVLLVGLGAVVSVRVPVIRDRERVELRTDEPPAAVRNRFAAPGSPLLALSREIAARTTRTENGASYEIEYLLGVRSVTHSFEVTGSDPLRVMLSLDGSPWSEYELRVERVDGATVVRIEGGTVRRYGLRRIPQRLVLRRYQRRAYAAAGFAVERYEHGWGV